MSHNVLRSILSKVICAALAGPMLGLVPALAADQPAPQALWGKQCAKDPNGKDICVVQQFISGQPGNTQLLLAQFGYIGPQNKPRLILSAPLGVVLPAGVTLGIDGAKPITVPFETCNPGGCLSIIDMDDAALTQFRKGKELTVHYVVAGAQKPQDLPVKLDGLDAALKSVAP